MRFSANLNCSPIQAQYAGTGQSASPVTPSARALTVGYPHARKVLHAYGSRAKALSRGPCFGVKKGLQATCRLVENGHNITYQLTTMLTPGHVSIVESSAGERGFIPVDVANNPVQAHFTD